jgi:hypothetical protein
VTPFGEDNPHGFVLVTRVGGPFAIAEEDAGLLRPCRLSKYVSFFIKITLRPRPSSTYGKIYVSTAFLQ